MPNLNKIGKFFNIFFWLIVFIVPIFLSFGNSMFHFQRVVHEYTRIFPFFIIFIINNFFLFKYFSEKKYSKYFFLSFITILIFSILGTYNFKFLQLINIELPHEKLIKIERFKELNRFFYHVIFSILIIGLNNAIKISINWIETREKSYILEKENLENQLSALKNQISPHFFMNTLNNIYALIDYDKEKAKDTVVKFSKIMRKMLYNDDNEIFTLKEEIDFINDFVELMKMRLNTNVEIILEFPDEIPTIKIPPFLFINFIENAFKHGIKAVGKSFIAIKIELENDFLCFEISNSKTFDNIDTKKTTKQEVENSLKRLKLIYNEDFEYITKETSDTFLTKIQINIRNKQ